MSVAALEYEPTSRARPVTVERYADVIRINVAMRWWYAPVPLWLVAAGNYGAALFVIWFIGSLVVRTILRIPKPPRAIFEVTDQHLSMELRHPMTDEITTHSWPRQAVAEIRMNRYGRGLYVNVPGQVKQTYLTDVSRQTIAMLETALREAIATVLNETLKEHEADFASMALIHVSESRSVHPPM